MNKQEFQIGDMVWVLKDNEPAHRRVTGVTEGRKWEKQKEDEEGNIIHKSSPEFVYYLDNTFVTHKEYHLAKTQGDLIDKIFFKK